MPFLDREFYGNPVLRWVASGAAAGVLFTVLFLLRRLATAQRRTLGERAATEFKDLAIDLIGQAQVLFLAILSLYLATVSLVLPDRVHGALHSTVVIASFIQIGLWSNCLITFLFTRYLQKSRERDPASATAFVAVVFVGRLVVWSAVALLSLDHFGIQITALLAGIGIGGIAIALAVQNILQDLFATMSIVIDKPFAIGDMIVVGDLMGTIEHIGLKTTRVRSISGEEILFTNSDLLKSRIRNFKRMFERQMLFTLGVVYETPQEKLAVIPQMIREIVEKQPQTRCDRAHFKNFGDFALIFEVAFYVKHQDLRVAMDVQQAIHLEIFHRFRQEGIEFAYPTQLHYVINKPGGAVTGPPAR